MRQVNPETLGALTSQQKGFIASIRAIEQDAGLTGINLKRAVADMFPPASLFAKEICDLPAVWKELRDFLDRRGANLQQHSSHRVINTLAHGLYEEPEDTQAAIDIAKEIVAAGRRPRHDLNRYASHSSSSGTVAPQMNQSASPHGTSAEKLAHNVAMRLRDNEKKFSGELGDSWMEFVDEYLQMSRDYNLSPAQKLQYLHNLLRGYAKRFYLDKVDGYATSFQQAVQMLELEYNSAVRQTRVKNYLNSLRITSFTAEGTEVSAALSNLYKAIIKLSRQAPRSHQGDAHKVEFLRNAVVGMPWSSEPLSRVATHSLTFQQLYAELEAALQLDKESKLATLRDQVQIQRKVAIPEETLGIHYIGQGRYLNNPGTFRGRKPVKSARFNQRPTSSYSGEQRSRKSPFDPLTVLGCFNCGGNHLIKDCRKPLNVAKSAAGKLEYYARKAKHKPFAVHQVLADLCQQLDGTESEADDHAEYGADDLSIFESLLTGVDESNLDNGEGDNAEDERIVETNQTFIINHTYALSGSEQFLGACVDSAAQRTVIGRYQAESYCNLFNVPFNLISDGTAKVFSFGTHKHSRLGRLNIRLPVNDSHFVPLLVDVADLNVPFPLGLDVMTEYKMVLDMDECTLASKLQGWQIPLRKKPGHLYYEWAATILLTETELVRVHKHFYHPNSERLFSLMRRADPGSTSPQVLKDLEKIEGACDVCQRLGHAPHRFRVAMPDENVVFNRTLCLDLMTIDGKQVLHIVDKNTKFSAASFLSSETADETWNTFMRIWACMYIGFPDVMETDQGPQFTSKRWATLLLMAGIKHKLSGVQSHNAIGVGERYHSFLRKIYTKVRRSHPKALPAQSLALAVKAMNDTAGSHGLVPTLLVFGVVPRIPIVPTELPDQVARMKAMHAARKEMATITAKSRIDTARRMNVPAASGSDLAIGMEVLVYREKPEDIWVGPFKIMDLNNKMVHVNIDGENRRLSIDKIKLYLSSETLEPVVEPKSLSTPPNRQEFPRDIIDELRDIIEQTKDNEIEASINVCRDNSTILSNSNHSLHDMLPEFDTNITKPLNASDPKAASPEFRKAMTDEVDGLKKRGTWKVTFKRDLPSDPNILGGRFVLTLKNVGTGNELAKARYVAQGHRDTEKTTMVHNITTLRQSSTRIIVSVAAVKKFRIFSHDVRQAYFQSSEKLTREVYLQPKERDMEHFGITQDQILKLRRPIYGMKDAGDYWGVTVDAHARKDLQLEPLRGDPSLYIKRNEEDVDGLMGMYVDDGCLAGNETMQRLTELTLKRFDSKPREWDTFEFFGTSVRTLKQGTFSISQKLYASKLRPLPNDVSFKQFRSHRAMFAWMGHTRPDVCYATNQAAQMTEKTFGPDKISKINKAILYTKSTPEICLLYNDLDKSSLHLRVCTDASFAGNEDLSSQLGFIILLCDNKNRTHVLDYSSRKFKRVVRSILGGEVYAFSAGFDRGFILQYDLQTIYKRAIPLHMMTDSLQLFDVITKGSATTEKRLMIDVAAARESYNKYEISNVGLVASDYNIADALTKEKCNPALEELLRTGKDMNPVKQWIIRTKGD